MKKRSSRGIVKSIYLTERENDMTTYLCEKMNEGFSQLMGALIQKEYYSITCSELSKKDKE